MARAEPRSWAQMRAEPEQIIDGKADYVLALKGNQETLHQEVIDYIDEQV